MKHLITWFLRAVSIVGYLLAVRWLMRIGKPRDDIWQAEEWWLRLHTRARRGIGLLRAALWDLTGQTLRRWQQLRRDSWRLEFGTE